MFLFGPARYILNLCTESFGAYLSDFFKLSLWTSTAYDDGWSLWWPQFYWLMSFTWVPLSGVFLGRISKGYTVRETLNVVFLIPAVFGVVWMILMPSKFAAVVIATVCGCCYKIAFSYAYAHGFALVPASRTDDATAITTAVYGIGTFVSTYYAGALLGLMHTDSYTKTWIVSAVIFAIMGIVELAFYLKNKEG